MDLQKLVSSNLKLYESIKPANPDNSFTVLATLNDHKDGELLALATGTQANLGEDPDDLKDCHAESLLKRAFKRYLTNKIAALITNSASREPKGNNLNELIATTCQPDLILLISQFPCGLIRRYEGEEPINPVTGEAIRRKPGRGQVIDGKTVYVEKDSCSVKLKRWAHEGLQGRRLNGLFGIKCRIRGILIGDCESDENFDYDCNLSLLRNFIGLEAHDLDISSVRGLRRDEFLYNPTKRPQPVALVWWTNSAGQKETEQDSADSYCTRQLKNRVTFVGQCELVVDGRRQGITKRQFETGRGVYRLKVSDISLRQDILSAARNLSQLASTLN